MKHNRRNRQEEAIKRLEKTLEMHEANAELTVAIMEDKKMSTGSADKVESIRQHKIKSAKITIENTREKMR
jgi:tRNA 2-selenouridine synthase SelU